MTAAPSRLWARIRAALERRSEAPALTFLEASMRPTAYAGGALLTRVAELREKLAALDLDRRAPFGILVGTQEAQVLHFLAALSLGLRPAILTPPNRKLDRTHFVQMLAGVTRRCRFSAIVSDVTAPELEATLVEPFTLRLARRDERAPGADVGDASFLQFSSGTTGLKRGVTVNDGAVLAQLDAYAAALGLGDDDVIVSWLPLYHDMGFVACFLLPLARGVHCVMLNPLDWVARPALWLRAVTTYGGTWSWNPNFAYAFMADRVPPADAAGVDLRSLRGLVNCAEPVTFESQARFHARFAAHGLRPDVFCGCYAMAETTYALTHGRSSDAGYLDPIGPAGDGALDARRPGVSVGRALPGVELEIVDDAGRALPQRRLGEVRVRSPFNFGGYYNNPEATAAAVRDGWYHTGDLGYRVGAELFVCGRKKDLLIVGGVNVWPQDLEALATSTPGIHPGRAVAFAEFDDARQTEKVVLLAETDVPTAERQRVTIAIRQKILASLQIANFEVHLLPLGTLVKTSSGKIARAENRARWTERALAA